MKYNLPIAASATVLAWSVIRYERTYNKLNELHNVQNYLRNVADYFKACNPDHPHREMNARRIFVQVGDKENDEQFWGRPEHIPANNRKSYFVTSKKPGSDVVGEMQQCEKMSSKDPKKL